MHSVDNVYTDQSKQNAPDLITWDSDTVSSMARPYLSTVHLNKQVQEMQLCTW